MARCVQCEEFLDTPGVGSGRVSGEVLNDARMRGHTVPEDICMTCFRKILAPPQDRASAVANRPPVYPRQDSPVTGWTITGWSFLGLGVLFILIGWVALSEGRFNLNWIALLYLGGALIPSGLLMACLGRVIAELIKIRNTISV